MNFNLLDEVKNKILEKKHTDNLFIEDDLLEVYISKTDSNTYYMLLIPKSDTEIDELNEESVEYFSKYLDIKKSYVSYKKDSVYIYF